MTCLCVSDHLKKPLTLMGLAYLACLLENVAHSPQPTPFQADHTVLTHDKLDEFKELDGYLFGIPTRYGMMCAQMKSFFDSTGGKAGQNGRNSSSSAS